MSWPLLHILGIKRANIFFWHQVYGIGIGWWQECWVRALFLWYIPSNFLMFKHHCRKRISLFDHAFLQCKILLLSHVTKSMNLDTMPCVVHVCTTTQPTAVCARTLSRLANPPVHACLWGPLHTSSLVEEGVLPLHTSCYCMACTTLLHCCMHRIPWCNYTGENTLTTPLAHAPSLLSLVKPPPLPICQADARRGGGSFSSFVIFQAAWQATCPPSTHVESLLVST